MNRRGFFRTLAAATAGFSILPPATTYERVWKAVAVPSPMWVDAPFEMSAVIFSPRDFMGEWKFIMPDCGPVVPKDYHSKIIAVDRPS